MPVLSLIYKEKIIKKYRFKIGKTINIGRKSDNTIVINNMSVSNHHARLDSSSGRYIVTDLKSKNGIFVNDELVISHELKDNDFINIGKHTIVINFEDSDKLLDETEDDSLESTLVLNTVDHNKLVKDSVSKITGRKELISCLNYIEGGSGNIMLTDENLSLGKSSECDIIISGMFIGNIAAIIGRRKGDYYLSYVEGARKPKVNEVIVKKSIKLKDLDIISLGDVKLQSLIYEQKKKK